MEITKQDQGPKFESIMTMDRAINALFAQVPADVATSIRDIWNKVKDEAVIPSSFTGAIERVIILHEYDVKCDTPPAIIAQFIEWDVIALQEMMKLRRNAIHDAFDPAPLLESRIAERKPTANMPESVSMDKTKMKDLSGYAMIQHAANDQFRFNLYAWNHKIIGGSQGETYHNEKDIRDLLAKYFPNFKVIGPDETLSGSGTLNDNDHA